MNTCIKSTSGCVCFTPTTNVWFVSNSGKMYPKQIQFLQIGDKVITASGKVRKITKFYKTEYQGEIYIIDENISATPTHEFYTFNKLTHTKQYIKIKNIDEKILTFINVDGKTFEKKIDLEEYLGFVYNIDVDEDHTYCVGNEGLSVKCNGSITNL